jgi:D-sedoheptulose 7-phosphate isomerase
MNIKSHLQAYAADVKSLLDSLPFGEIEDVIQILQGARSRKGRVFIMGNGGSASTATHFVCDLAKNTRSPISPDFRVVGLSDNMALFSAYANDDGYSNVFRYQLLAQVEPDDIVIAISTSGNSENVIEAVRDAKRAGAYTIGFTGFSSGTLGKIVDKRIHIDCNCIEQVEDLHLLLEHMIVHTIKEIEAQSSMREASVIALDSMEKEEGQEVGVYTDPQSAYETLPEAERTTRAETLYNFSKIIADPNRSESLIRQLLRTAVKTFSATSGSLMLFSEGNLAGEMLSYNGEVLTVTDEQQLDVASQGLAGWVRERMIPALITNTREDPRWLNRTWDEGEAGPRSAMAIPFFHEGQVIGVLTLVRPYGFSFAEQEFAVFSAVSHCFSMYGEHIKSEGSIAV